MGYYTRHAVEIIEGPSESILENETFDVDYSFEEVQGSSLKWYDCHRDMLDMSMRHPDSVFQVTGFGEEVGDYWRKYYKNGKWANATHAFSPYKEEELS